MDKFLFTGFTAKQKLLLKRQSGKLLDELRRLDIIVDDLLRQYKMALPQFAYFAYLKMFITQLTGLLQRQNKPK